jgi:hypothetical protein
MYRLIKKYQTGGLIDTDAMTADVKNDSTFFKDGAYTASGRKRLTAIVQIQENQGQGLRYNINDDSSRFEIVDPTGKQVIDSEGRGIGTAENAGIFYGTVNRYKKSKKEVSKAISTAGNYIIQPADTLKPKVATPQKSVETPNDPVETPESSSDAPKSYASGRLGTQVTPASTFRASGLKGATPHDLLGTWQGFGTGNAGGAGGAGGPDEVQLDPETGQPIQVVQAFDYTISEDMKPWEEKVNTNISGLLTTNWNHNIKDSGGWGKFDETFLNESLVPLNEVLRLRNIGEQDLKLEKSLGLAEDLTDEGLLKDIEGKKTYHTNVYRNQLSHNVTDATTYIDDEIKRLQDTSWANDSDRLAAIQHLQKNRQDITDRYDKAYEAGNSKGFREFYGEDLPTHYNTYYDTTKKEIHGSWASYNGSKKEQQTIVDAEKLVGYQKVLTSQLVHGTSGFNGNGNMPAALLENGSRVDLYMIRDAIDAATTDEELKKIYVPVLVKGTKSSNGSGAEYKLQTAYNFVNGNPWYVHVNSETNKGDIKKFLWNYGYNSGKNSYKEGGTLRVPKAQSGMNLNVGSIQAIQELIRQQKAGEVINPPSAGSWSDTPNTGPSNPYATGTPAYNITSPTSPSPASALVAKPRYNPISVTSTSTADYAGSPRPADSRVTAVNAVGSPNRFASTGTGSVGVGTPEKTDGDQISLEGTVYRQDDDMPVNTNKISTNGPIISRTGINTPIGEVQYNDILQLGLAHKAYKEKITEIQPFQKKFQPKGARHVLAARDLDAGTINKVQNDIATMRSGYRGSDPVMSALSTLMTNDQRGVAKRDFLVKRGAYRREEEDRVANQMEERRVQLSADTQGQHITNEENRFLRYQGDLQAASEEKRRKDEWRANLGSTGAAVQSRWNGEAAADKQYRTGLVVQEHQQKVNQAQSAYQMAKNYLTDYQGNGQAGVYGQVDPTELQSAQQAVQDAYKALNEIQTTNISDAGAEADKINAGRSIMRWRRG